MAGSSKVTTAHKEIREWVEQRDGKPVTVTGTGGTESRFFKFISRDSAKERGKD